MGPVTLESLSMMFTGGCLIWLGRQVITTRDTVAKIHVALFGIDGKNGLRGAVEKLEERVDQCQLAHGLSIVKPSREEP